MMSLSRVPSFPRRRESKLNLPMTSTWVPACAGTTHGSSSACTGMTY